MKRFLVLNGPNINFTGIREVGVYGAETFESILEYLSLIHISCGRPGSPTRPPGP